MTVEKSSLSLIVLFLSFLNLIAQNDRNGTIWKYHVVKYQYNDNGVKQFASTTEVHLVILEQGMIVQKRYETQGVSKAFEEDTFPDRSGGVSTGYPLTDTFYVQDDTDFFHYFEANQDTSMKRRMNIYTFSKFVMPYSLSLSHHCRKICFLWTAAKYSYQGIKELQNCNKEFRKCYHFQMNVPDVSESTVLDIYLDTTWLLPIQTFTFWNSYGKKRILGEMNLYEIEQY